MGYIGLILTFGLPWAILAAALSPAAWWSWALLAAALGFRCAVALQVGQGVVHDTAVARRLWLLPLRDLIAFGVWFWSFADNKVRWRGDVFILEDGKIRPQGEVEIEGDQRITAEPERDKVSAHW
jgi:ceramide glucosyltransferase